MSTISVITPPSEPGVVQLYAVGIDVSAAYVAGVSQATWWLSTQEARHRATTSAPNSCPPWRGAPSRSSGRRWAGALVGPDLVPGPNRRRLIY